MSAITNEEEFRKVKDALVSRESAATFHSERFVELSKFVAESLERQDSDKALTLITKGALSF